MKARTDTSRYPRSFLLIVLALCASAPALAALKHPAKPLPRGFAYQLDTIPEGPWSVHVVLVDRSYRNLQFHTALGKGDRIGLAPLSEQMDLLPGKLGRPVAAINGDYYRDEGDYEGDPKGLMILGGELVSSPCGWTCLWIDAQGNAWMTNVTSQFEVTWGNGQKTPFGLNEERARDAAVLYTARVGTSTRTRKGLELVLRRDDGQAWLPFQAGQTYLARIDGVLEGGNSPTSSQFIVLSIGPELLDHLPRPRPGDRLKISTATSPDVSGALTAIGGGPALVRDGKIVPRDEVRVRNPRTAVGWSRDYFYLVEVDGRQRRISEGMTTEELSNYMLQLGCDEAMSLDGGGSATCWVYGLVMNRPSEGFERAMANSLVVVQKPRLESEARP